MRLRRKKVKGIPADQLDKVMKSERVHKAVDIKAAAVQAYWKSVSPVFNPADPREHRKTPPHGQAGDYQNSVIIEDLSDDSGFRDRVKPTDFKAKWIEFGTANRKPDAPMAKTKARFRK